MRKQSKDMSYDKDIVIDKFIGHLMDKSDDDVLDNSV